MPEDFPTQHPDPGALASAGLAFIAVASMAAMFGEWEHERYVLGRRFFAGWWTVLDLLLIG
jgi:hypothetical protein